MQAASAARALKKYCSQFESCIMCPLYESGCGKNKPLFEWTFPEEEDERPLDPYKFPALMRLMGKQFGGGWPCGYPVSIFSSDGLVCVIYQNGDLYKYDVDRETWF